MTINEIMNNVFTFHQLKNMRLEYLPKLRSFNANTKKTSAEECNVSGLAQLFNDKVEFPILDRLILSDESIFEGTCHVLPFCKVPKSLEVHNCRNLVNVYTLLQRFETTQLTLVDLPKLERNWIMEPQGHLVFHNLTKLTVEKLGLKCLFSLSMAKSLAQLRDLRIQNCGVMEEILKNQGGGGGENATDEIEFSQLGHLILSYLPNLTCFCQANNAFKFPSLTRVDINVCPELKTFTSGYLSTPDILVYKDWKFSRVSDLNNHVQQFPKGKGVAVEDNNDAETS
ncbi:uncharacterized protein LOC132303353 isoform X2 [Cornus florida]|uniref:uncharacterized protein LOC132303353 isoform X2 n=1 Tax=Cornus florida TaxID=4283 RepID=UPI0028A193DA|nr:uncharacterized protein LOC132303353 isoform X2 [Cornus florida]